AAQERRPVQRARRLRREYLIEPPTAVCSLSRLREGESGHFGRISGPSHFPVFGAKRAGNIAVCGVVYHSFPRPRAAAISSAAAISTRNPERKAPYEAYRCSRIEDRPGSP